MSRSTVDRERLKSIVALTKRIQQKVSRPLRSNPSPFPDIPPLQLTSIIGEFKAKLLKNSLQPQIYQLALNKIYELDSVYQRTYLEICQKLWRHDLVDQKVSLEQLRKIQSLFERLFETKDIPLLLRSILDANSSHYAQLSSSNKEERRAFNHESTPILENYFVQNPYPSSADRLILAREAKMSLRQIDVWFQNHRARARREGKTMQRTIKSILSGNSPKSGNVDLIESCVHRDSTLESRNAVTESPTITFPHTVDSNETCTLDISRTPSHAFPTKYPPNNIENPFPCDGGRFNFPPPPWYRTPACQTPRATQVSHSDMEALVANFADLTIHKSPSHSRKARSASPASTESSSVVPWHLAITGVLCPAPLPALITQTTTPAQSCLRSIKPPHSQRVPQHRKQGFLSWANSTQSLKTASHSPPLPSIPRRSVSSLSTTAPLAITPPASPPLSSSLDVAQNVGSLLSNVDRTINSFFELNTYTPSLSDFMKHFSPSVDNLFSSFSFPLEGY
ncbi:hypothetical protein CVT24_004338 [Panaeolus cyanescens]|uniref:Homeobox domain-containing protein n=1 Tax=Panaeolus cyanescens TaxID=181874 RepID=A0A409VAB7_9AGAR|nr:hypothetical protein CVT24_004338 [Panaeolus cyanescens]